MHLECLVPSSGWEPTLSLSHFLFSTASSNIYIYKKKVIVKVKSQSELRGILTIVLPGRSVHSQVPNRPSLKWSKRGSSQLGAATELKERMGLGWDTGLGHCPSWAWPHWPGLRCFYLPPCTFCLYRKGPSIREKSPHSESDYSEFILHSCTYSAHSESFTNMTFHFSLQ